MSLYSMDYYAVRELGVPTASAISGSSRSIRNGVHPSVARALDQARQQQEQEQQQEQQQQLLNLTRTEKCPCNITIKVEGCGGRGMPIGLASVQYLVQSCLLWENSKEVNLVETLILDHCPWISPLLETIRPLLSYLRDPRCTIENLGIPGNRFGDEACQVLLQSLAANSIRRLDLNTNYLEHMGPDLRRLLSTQKNLKSLDLSYNWVTMETFQQMVDGAPGVLWNLQELNVEGCVVGDAGVLPLLEQFSDTNSHLTNLILSNNELTQASLLPLARLLNSNTLLEHLDLSWNEHLFDCVENYASDDEVSLEGNPNDIRNGRNVWVAEEQESEAQIDTQLQTVCALQHALEEFGAALGQNKHLVSLNLSNCDLFSMSMTAPVLLKACRVNSTLRFLDLSHNHEDSVGKFSDQDDVIASLVGATLPDIQGLRHLSLDAAYAPSIEAWKSNFSLVRVDLNKGGRVSSDLFQEELDQIGPRNRAIQRAKLLVRQSNSNNNCVQVRGVKVCQWAFSSPEMSHLKDYPASFYIFIREMLWKECL